MLIKKRGYVLLNSINLINFMTILTISGASIFKMNLEYSTKYSVYGSIKDLNKVQKIVLETTNKWIDINSDEITSHMDKDRIYRVNSDEYFIRLYYYKDTDTFKIGYGKDKVEDFMYCTYNKEFIDQEDTEDSDKNFKINLILKREVLEK